MELSKFYEELDSRFEQHDQKAVESFLLDIINSSNVDTTKIAAANELGCFYRGISLFQKSIATFMIALNAISSFIGVRSKEYATAIMNMAGTYRLSGDLDLALAHFQEAKEIYEAEQINDPYGLASLLNNMALVYQDCGKPQQAIQNLCDSLKLLEMVPDKEIQVATTYNNLALLYHSTGDTDGAEKAIHASLAIFQKEACCNNPHHAATLNTMALIFYKKGGRESARACLLKALDITEMNYGRNIEYAICCQNIAQILAAESDHANALQYMEDAWGIMQSIYGSNHPNTKKTRESADELRRKVNAVFS